MTTWLRALLVLVPLLSAPALADDRASGERLVTRASLVAESFEQDTTFDDIGNTVADAYGVVVVPEMIKGGFFVGANYGMGVLLLRNLQTLGWSQPVFVRVYGGSFGLQFGGKTSNVIITLMNPEAVNRLLEHKLTLGGEASAAIGPVGAKVGAATTSNLGRDVYVFAHSKGLFGGFALDGTVVIPSDKWNALYYGQPITPYEIVKGRPDGDPASARLRAALAAFG